MFLRNERLSQTRKVSRGANKGMHVDNQVLSTVEDKYSLMEQQHALIRAETLAGHNPDIGDRNMSIEPKFRET
jgi:hypothetical protein